MTALVIAFISAFLTVALAIPTGISTEDAPVPVSVSDEQDAGLPFWKALIGIIIAVVGITSLAAGVWYLCKKKKAATPSSVPAIPLVAANASLPLPDASTEVTGRQA